jgi:hypothetical protein
MGAKNHSALNTGAGNMVLSICGSELTITDRCGNEITPVEADEHGYVFVSGIDAVNSKGALLFSVSGSDEYSATVHNVLSYTITKGIFMSRLAEGAIEAHRQAAYVVAIVGGSLDD